MTRPTGLRVLAFLAVLLSSGIARAGLDVLPLDQVRKGMTGYGLTVFEGTAIERFPVEVVDVLRNFLPKQDVILVRCGGRASVDQFGIAAGMSGSPIYLEGKLAGALAYGWDFMHEALAGITPIETMLRDTDRPPERVAGAGASGEPGPRTGDGRTRPLVSPLLVSGLSSRGLERLREELEPLRLRPIQAGGGGSRPGLETLRLEPGAACSVDLMRGDVSASILGTVTAVDGETVLAFGHSFFESGERTWPLATAWVNYTFGSAWNSFKMGETGRPVGSLLQDRQAAVRGRLGVPSPMIPAVVRVTNGVTKRSETYRVEVVRDPYFTNVMLGNLLADAVSSAESGLGPNRIRVELRMRIAGRKDPVVYRDVLASDFRPSAYGAATMVGRLLRNPFAEVALESLDLEAEVVHDEGTAEIDSVVALRSAAAPGETVTLRVTLRPPRGERRVVTLPVELPRELRPGTVVRLLVLGGDDVTPDVPAPVDVEGVIRVIESYHPSTDLVVEIPVPRIDVSHRGRLVRGLPTSALEALLPSSGSPPGETRQGAVRFSLPTDHAVRGTAALLIAVVEPRR